MLEQDVCRGVGVKCKFNEFFFDMETLYHNTEFNILVNSQNVLIYYLEGHWKLGESDNLY